MQYFFLWVDTGNPNIVAESSISLVSKTTLNFYFDQVFKSHRSGFQKMRWKPDQDNMTTWRENFCFRYKRYWWFSRAMLIFSLRFWSIVPAGFEFLMEIWCQKYLSFSLKVISFIIVRFWSFRFGSAICQNLRLLMGRCRVPSHSGPELGNGSKTLISATANAG